MSLLFLCWFYVVSHSHEHHPWVTSTAKLGLHCPWQLVYPAFTFYIYYFWLPLPLPSAVQCSSTVLRSQEIPSLPSLTTGTGTVGGDMGKEAHWANFIPGKKYLRDFMEVDYLKGFSMTSNFCWNWAGEDQLF